MKKRAARFGVPLVTPKPAEPAAAAKGRKKGEPTDPALLEKISKRRERFGNVAPSKPAPTAEEQERVDKRKQRFGDVLPDAKKQQGDKSAEAKPAPELSEEMKAKFEARAKRFGAGAAPS
jgi:hypothetical protein